ncbi:MAG: hypothetical protein J6B34_01635 [Clostridia bacterium]|nr:hypothetical protein [Clostridia bacterium]
MKQVAKVYKKIPLVVDALFLTNGTIKPRRIILKEGTFDITKVLSVRRHCPLVVPCVAPLEYTVLVEGQQKNLYFDTDSGQWFSIKEILHEGKGYSAQ